MVTNTLIICKHFRIQDRGLYITVAFAHTVDLVLTEVVGDIIDLLLDRLDLLQGKVTDSGCCLSQKLHT